MSEFKLAAQQELEVYYDKNQLYKRLHEEFGKFPIPSGIDEDFARSLLVHMNIHKQAEPGVMVGLLFNYFGNAQETADEIMKAVEMDLVDYDPRVEQLIVKYEVSSDVQAEIDLFQYLLPMVIKPLKIVRNEESGNLLIQTGVLLGDAWHNKDVVLSHLNRMNKVKLSLNKDVVKYAKNVIKNLDKPKQGESKVDFKMRKTQFQRFKHESEKVRDLMYQCDNEFYFTWKYDFRGRCYSQGYHINFQSYDWQRASIEFANGEIVE